MIPIISYGTENKHKNSIKRLEDSCNLLKYPHYLVVLPDRDFREDRFKYLYKPTFIRETIEKLQKPVIWMDADSFLINIPKIQERNITFDFGYILSPTGSHKWFADSCHVHNVTNISFLRQWEAFCLEEKDISDHTQLLRTFEFMKGETYTRNVSDYFKGCYIRNYKGHDEIRY
ncbi:MAG: hypothetical protein ACOC1X_02740 [Promethearchaeota archaeon]